MTESDLIDRTHKAMEQLQQDRLAGHMPYTQKTEGILRALADLKAETQAVMHGSPHIGKGGHLLTDLADSG